MPLKHQLINILLPLLAIATLENYTQPLPSVVHLPVLPSDAADMLRVTSAPRGAELISLTLSGSGCPSGGAYTGVHNASLYVYTPQLMATSGPDESGAMKGRRFCQVVLDVKAPEGWQMGLKVAESIGYVSIGESVEGQVVGTSYFSGDEKEVRELPFLETRKGVADLSRVLGRISWLGRSTIGGRVAL
jgi:hypothetical protein